MSYEALLVEKDAGVCTISLNRPERLNAINYQLTSLELDAITLVAQD